MKREVGYYWVKCKNWSGVKNDIWKVVYYSNEYGGTWMKDEIGYRDEDFIEINENRIKSPDEK